ncbi:CRISPR-associated protein Cas4 [bacterium]|nr:CRISPR-associated protein Cas4 [bacterium]
MEDYLPVSALNQWSYCPRRCGLIHVEGDFDNNEHTLAGVAEHQRVDAAGHDLREGIRVELALAIWSHQHRLTGRCDVVEFYDDGRVRPVEYKLGKRKPWENDDLQVAAQALCLEEMLGLQILECAIFHRKSQRLRKVELTADLRKRTVEAIESIRSLMSSGQLPAPTHLRHRCGECSLSGICEPELWRAAHGGLR